MFHTTELNVGAMSFDVRKVWNLHQGHKQGHGQGQEQGQEQESKIRSKVRSKRRTGSALGSAAGALASLHRIGPGQMAFPFLPTHQTIARY